MRSRSRQTLIVWRYLSLTALQSVDPSSVRTGGSILGDKTRMPLLSREADAYIRPSPTSGTLGGLTRTTAEAMVMCEGAGFDVILVETVGVGQSEIMVANAVDMTTLLVSPGGGDDLQGMKKGIMEIADLVVVNKSDGDLLPLARHTRADYSHALQLTRPKWDFWRPPVLMNSNVNPTEVEAHRGGVQLIWDTMNKFKQELLEKGKFYEQRASQRGAWFWVQLQEELMARIRSDPDLATALSTLQRRLQWNAITPRRAAQQLVSQLIGHGANAGGAQRANSNAGDQSTTTTTTRA